MEALRPAPKLAILPPPAPSKDTVRTPGHTLGLVAAAGLLASCASYADRTEDALRDFRSGAFSASAEAYADQDVTKSAFLSGAESGTAWFTAGEWGTARQAFESAERASYDIEERALVSANDLGESLSSWLLNDSTQAYPGEGFERVYLHVFLGLCYLAEGKLEDVLVEVRRANMLLEAEEELYDSAYEAGGLGHFLSAVTYELLGKPDDAFIDYMRMADKGVGLELAGPALVRLAKQTGRDDYLEALVKRFGDVTPPPANAASIVVIAGVGLGPQKEERGFAVQTLDGALQVAVPHFVRRGQPVGNLRLVVADGTGSVRTAPVEVVADVAEENLDDRIVKIAVKSVARTVAKRELTKQLQDDHGFAGRLIGDVFNLATERADLRFWQTLPDSWQAARMFVEPGVVPLQLEAGPAGTATLGAFQLEPGETMFVLARTVDQRLFAHTLGGRLVVEDPVPAAPGETPNPTVQP